MTTIVVKAALPLDYASIHTDRPAWRTEVEEWVAQGKPIKYSAEELPIIPSDLHEEMVRHHYVQYVRKGHYEERYLVRPVEWQNGNGGGNSTTDGHSL